MKVTIFKELFKTDVPYHVDISKIIDRIKNGTSKDIISEIRKGNKELKTKLPCIIFSGTFSQRNKKSLIEHSGLLVLDFDKVDNIENFKNELKKNKHFTLLFTSPSGNGVKGVIKIPKCNQDEHTKYFKKFEEEFNIQFLDSGGSNIDRVCFESYDPEIYINLDSEVYNPSLEDEGYKISERVPILPLTNEDDIISKIMAFSWTKSFKEGERNNFVFDLAGAFCEYGVSESVAISYMSVKLDLGSDFTESELKNCIKSAYKLRSFSSKYFEDYKKKELIIKDLKYSKEDVIKKHNIDNTIYEEISNESDNAEFWHFDKNGKVKIDPFKYKYFLESNGFRKYFPNGVLKPQLVRVDSNKVSDTSHDIIKDFVLDWLLENDEIEVWKRCVNYQNLFADQFLSMLDTIDLMMLKDTKTKSFIAFNNGIVEVTKDSIKLRDYIDVDGYIWKDSIINRNFVKSELIDNEYKTFINNISNNEPEAIECVIGYLLSSYKNKMNNKAIILNDEVISENPEGGTGKGLFIQGIKSIKKTAILDGKSFDDKKSFAYQTVSQDTSVLVFDDVKKNFNFESKFSLVTEGLTLERKNKDAIKLTVEESPKIVISTNYAIKGEGNSHSRRRHELEFAQYYNGDRTPYDEFGRQLFDDWSEEEFNNFDNYMIKCLQTYLSIGLVKQNAKNIKLRKFIAESSMEFYEWINDKQNISINIMIDKSLAFEQFTTEYQDFRKWLTRKKFNIWVQKYCSYKGYQYKDGHSQGMKWFMLSTDDFGEEVDDEQFPF